MKIKLVVLTGKRKKISLLLQMYHVAGNDPCDGDMDCEEIRQAKSEDETLLGSVIKNTWNLVSPLLLPVAVKNCRFLCA